ncbi:hypothetical protein BJ912DRAFT_458538 [Pholiota molesta]|nr:hypothetical protein BJ912DRAFT_458538 [Pholiota molesta]
MYHREFSQRLFRPIIALRFPSFCHVDVAESPFCGSGKVEIGPMTANSRWWASVCHEAHACIYGMCLFVCGYYDRHDRPLSVVFSIPYVEFGPLPLSIIHVKYRGHHHPLCILLCLHQEFRMRRGRPILALDSAHSPSHHPQEIEGEDGGRNALSIGGCLHDWVVVLKTRWATGSCIWRSYCLNHAPARYHYKRCYRPRYQRHFRHVFLTTLSLPNLWCKRAAHARTPIVGLLSVDFHCGFVHPLFPVRGHIGVMDVRTGVPAFGATFIDRPQMTCATHSLAEHRHSIPSASRLSSL